MKKVFLITLVLLIHHCLFAQNFGPDKDIKTSWKPEEIDDFLNKQASVTLGLADSVFKMHPPLTVEQEIRKMALVMIDNVLHEEKAAYRPAVQSFFHKRIENAVEEIRTEKVEAGAVIWKLYNHTFIVKTPTIIIGFDITRGLRIVEGFTLSEELIKGLIDVVDVLFISHIHDDHADSLVAEMFLAQNKPVISPPDVYENLPIYNKIFHPERKAHEIQEVYLPLKRYSLKFVNYPGHQKATILNNVYLVFSPEGMCFSHTGDQYYLEDFEWIDRVGDLYPVDVLMPNCWTADPPRVDNGFRPRLIITGHENEMGHAVIQRKPYWLNYERWFKNNSVPCIQITWGEKFPYKKPK